MQFTLILVSAELYISMIVCIQDNSKLYMNLLDLELSGDLRVNGGGVQQCVSKALAAPLSSDSKILFSQRGLQFAEDFGTTVQRSEAG